MCFSAAASFTVAAVLFPVGAYCIKTAKHIDKKWIPIAISPMVFSIQQAIEGVLWLGINTGNETIIYTASRGFVFFSHLFWLAWVPFCVYCLEDQLLRRKLLLLLTGIGTVSGLSVFLPALFIPDWLSVKLVEHSVEYRIVLIYDAIANRTVLQSFYAFVVLSALFVSSDWRIRIFGGLATLSLVFTYLFFVYAFISVWCFFAAVLSTYIVVILENERRRERIHP